MRLLAWCPQPLDGTAYWRVASPLARLRQQVSDFHFTIVERADTNDVLAHDVLLLQRPFLDEHVAAMETAKALGRRVWCDWDDDIMDVPANNGRVFLYRSDKHQENVRQLARGADVVTVTCEELRRRFAPHAGARAMIVPNALDPTLSAGAADEDILPVRQIAWRGGDSHNEDLDRLGGAFPKVAREAEGRAIWHFVGMTPYQILNRFPAHSVYIHNWIGDVVSYFRFMARLRPSVLAVPLVDVPFNRKKSNICCIEAAWMGAVPVAPKWLEGCALPGVYIYEDDGDFERALREAALAPADELAQRLVLLRAAVAKDYGLDGVNMLRLAAMKRALGGASEAA